MTNCALASPEDAALRKLSLPTAISRTVGATDLGAAAAGSDPVRIGSTSGLVPFSLCCCGVAAAAGVCSSGAGSTACGAGTGWAVVLASGAIAAGAIGAGAA